MLRKVLLLIVACFVSFGLTAIAGYVLYMYSDGQSESYLSSLVRFVVNPIIAVLVGGLVGLLSKDRPVTTSIIGLAPWTIMLIGPYKPLSFLNWISWLGPICAQLSLGAIAAEVAGKLSKRPKSNAWKSLPRS